MTLTHPLIPCPWCSKAPTVECNGQFAWVECPCGATSPLASHRVDAAREAGAVASWNAGPHEGPRAAMAEAVGRLNVALSWIRPGPNSPERLERLCCTAEEAAAAITVALAEMDKGKLTTTTNEGDLT